MQNDRPEHAAVFYDGTSNRKRRIALRFAQQLELVENGVIIASWPYDDVRRADGHKTLRLSAISALPLARLDIEDETTARALRARCGRSEEHTSELQSTNAHLVCRLLLEKKKHNTNRKIRTQANNTQHKHTTSISNHR